MARRPRWLTLVTLLALLAACNGGCTAARADDEAAAATATAPATQAPSAGAATPKVATSASTASTPVAPSAGAASSATAPVAQVQATAAQVAAQAARAAQPACVAARARIAGELANGEPRLTRPLQLSADDVSCIVAAVPALAPLTELLPFDDDAIDAALKRGKRSRGAIHVWQIEPAVLVWSPVPEQRLLVLSGQAGARGAISVLRLAKDGAVEHLASTLLDEAEPGIALGSSEQYPRNLMWTTCYECPGAGGNIRFEDDASVSFLYR